MVSRHSRDPLGGNPAFFLKGIDSGWSLSPQVVSGEPARMTKPDAELNKV